MMWSRKVVALFVAWVLLSSCAHAQPDSSGKSQFDFAVKINDTSEVITVIRDAVDTNQWFYVPSRPRVVIRNQEPVFAMVKYQGHDPNNRSKVCQGALVQFSVTMSIPPEAISQIVSKIEAKMPPNTKIKLSALPFNECKIDLLKPSGEFLAESEEAKSITTSFGSSEIPFQVKLNTLGTDVYEELCRGNTGLPVIVTYKYPAWTPETMCTAEIDFKQAFENVSKSTDFQGQIGYAGSGLSAGVNKEKVRELMKGDKGIKVNIMQADDKDQDFIDKCFQPVLEKLYTELFDGPKFPADFKADPAVAKAPDIIPTETQIAKDLDTAVAGNASPTASGTSGTGDDGSGGIGKALGGLGKAFGSVNNAMNSGQLKVQLKIGFAMKDIKKVREGKTTIDFRKRRLVEKTGGCGSFIGVGPFIKKNPELATKLIRDVSRSGWENAEFILPKATGLQELGVETIALTVSVVDKDKKQVEPEGVAQAVVFDPSDAELGWSKDKQTATKLNFPLKTMMSKYSKDKVTKEFQYKIVANIQLALPTGTKDNLVLTQYQPLVTGDIAMSTPLQFLSTLQFDASGIDWDAAKLSGVNINLEANYLANGARSTKKLSASISKAKRDVPVTLQIPVGEDGKVASVTGKINCIVKGKTIVSSVGQVPNIVDAGPVLFLFQEWDEDGKPQ